MRYQTLNHIFNGDLGFLSSYCADLCYNVIEFIEDGIHMKNKILKVLIDQKDGYISGENLSQMFGVSRTAIWKHIQTLKKEGYQIVSVTNKGYHLKRKSSDVDQIALEQITCNSNLVHQVLYFDQVDSTNNEAKRLGETSDFMESLIVAREQVKGKGRMGRAWISEKDSGIWMSLLLKPSLSPDMVSKITLIAAAAASGAIEEESGLVTGIKWPNDIVIERKKVCGILAELSAELGHIHYLVVGVGINVSQSVFDESIADKATSLMIENRGKPVNRLNIIKRFVEIFEMYYNQFVHDGLFDSVVAYNIKKSVTIGEKVNITAGERTRTAFAKTIDNAGNLIVTNEDGTDEAVFFGEVSVRGINGYI
jgi:BirA family biotin operon repressor/biotin-[acetyl-CoA-carboxylase] ligase